LEQLEQVPSKVNDKVVREIADAHGPQTA